MSLLSKKANAATGILTQTLSLRHIGKAIIGLKIIAVIFFGYWLIQDLQQGQMIFDENFKWFILAGFLAQLIDGALGMAYGVSCTTLLLNFGLPPVLASASVHTSEIFTTGVSGLAHLKFRNIDKQLFFRIIFTGVSGALLGAFLLSAVLDGSQVRPFIAAYLLVLGVLILIRGLRNTQVKNKRVKRIGGLTFIGGLLDACGGGGWGPIVSSNLINQGSDPRMTIGTVNTAEFFVTFFATAVFIFFLGVQFWQIVIGLVIGGTLAAPAGAYLLSRINKRFLMIFVGLLIIVTSCYTIYKAFQGYRDIVDNLMG